MPRHKCKSEQDYHTVITVKIRKVSNVIYLQENVCVICGFCFETRETTTSGDVIVKKLNNLKLKLTAERVQNIEKVIESKENFNFDGPKGICVKCNRSIERVLRLKNEIRSLTEHIKDANTRTMRAFTLALPSPTRGLCVYFFFFFFFFTLLNIHQQRGETNFVTG